MGMILREVSFVSKLLNRDFKGENYVLYKEK